MILNRSIRSHSIEMQTNASSQTFNPQSVEFINIGRINNTRHRYQYTLYTKTMCSKGLCGFRTCCYSCYTLQICFSCHIECIRFSITYYYFVFEKASPNGIDVVHKFYFIDFIQIYYNFVFGKSSPKWIDARIVHKFDEWRSTACLVQFTVYISIKSRLPI